MFETSLPNNNAFYRSVWYPLAFSSAAAFHQILSMFPVYLKTTGLAHIVSDDDAYVLLHHNEAVRRVRESLENPESAASDDGILATITGMICQSVGLSSIESLQLVLTNYIALDWGCRAMDGPCECIEKSRSTARGCCVTQL